MMTQAFKQYSRVYYRYCFEKITWMLKEEVESVISKIYVSKRGIFIYPQNKFRNDKEY